MWSNFNQYPGIQKGPYEFKGVDLISYMNYDGELIYDNPIERGTSYDDKTGLLSIQDEIRFKWDHYIKID